MTKKPTTDPRITKLSDQYLFECVPYENPPSREGFIIWLIERGDPFAVARLQTELEQARAALAFVVKVRPLVDTLGRQVVNTYINMDLIDSAFEAAAAFLEAQPQPARADDTRTAGE
jgi:hypothetical protein